MTEKENSKDDSTTDEIATSDFRQFLCFRLGKSEFAIDVMNVREIVRASDVTRNISLEGNPSYEISHQGKPTRVFDLRAIFHQGEPTLEDNTRVIFVDPDQRHFGMMVDGVSEIVRVKTGSVQPSQVSSEKMRLVFPEQIGIGGRSLLCLDPTQLSTSPQPKDS